MRHGEIGDALIETVKELGGLLTHNDLRESVLQIGEARRLAFRGYELWAPTAPCGTVTQFEMLKIWEALHPHAGHREDTIERIRHLAEVTWHAFADRYHWLGDPHVVPVPEAGLLSDGFAKAIAASIRDGDPPPRADSAPWEIYARSPVHDPWRFEGRPGPVWRPAGATAPTSGTTHICAMDRDGMAVSLTHTAANHFGSKVVCERTGLLFDAAMGWFNARPGAANSIEGRKRRLANIGP